MKRFTILLAHTLLAAAGVCAETVSGSVRSADGRAIAQARVSDVTSDQHVISGDDGVFAVECALPCTLLVEHARFIEVVTDPIVDVSTALEVALTPKNAFFEQVVVSASRGNQGDAFAPVSVAATQIEVDERLAPPASLTELVEGVAGVAENGQGGLFQVYSIRGISRHRVLTLLSGMTMTSERRAGVATSFLDPLLMGNVDVVRGPASTYYGSGALGGVVQVFPRVFDGFSFDAGYDSFGDSTYQTLGWGQDGWSFGLARRDVGNDDDAQGNRLFAQFNQVSATASRNWQTDNRQYELLLIASRGTDIGKPNTDFPDRITEYPNEEHTLFRFAVTGAAGWRFSAWGHPHELETSTLRVDSRTNDLRNETLDFGTSYQRDWSRGAVSGVWGVDYFGRRGVDSFERELRFDGNEVTIIEALDGAEQDEAAGFASARWRWGPVNLQAGTRYTTQRQNNAGFSSTTDGAWTGFLGAVRSLGGGFELTANAGTGLRFPTLSERFFSGTTGRGGVIGNPDLDPERSLSLDLGLRWFGKTVFVAGGVFRQDIDDYIERVELTDDILSFVNLTSGTIEGLEVEGFWEPTERWHLSWNGHLLDGQGDDGQALADIPTDRVQLGARFTEGAWQAGFEYQYRNSKNDPGPGELSIAEAHLVSMSLRYQFDTGLALTVQGRNLFDEVYFNSADDKTQAARGRSVGLSIAWQPN